MPVHTSFQTLPAFILAKNWTSFFSDLVAPWLGAPGLITQGAVLLAHPIREHAPPHPTPTPRYLPCPGGQSQAFTT